MKAIICDNSWKAKWENFISENSCDGGLLQSWDWGIFQESIGRKVFRIALVDESGNIKSGAQGIIYKLPLKKKYLYIPRGPIVNDILSLEFKKLLLEINKLAKKKRVLFVRMDPPLVDDGKKTILKNLGLESAGEVQPQSTLILDLTKSEAEILAQMKAKTRYNIKVAQKHCVAVDEGENYFEDFWRLMQLTAKRDKIQVHSKKYYRQMLKVLGEGGKIKLFVAKYEQKVIAANLVAKSGKWCVYLHGASDYGYRDKMAPYLLQWESIAWAKSRWCEFYDFWGANENKWPGVTRFKTGFAPEKELTEYVGAWDMSVDHLLYLLYRIIKRKKFAKYKNKKAK